MTQLTPTVGIQRGGSARILRIVLLVVLAGVAAVGAMAALPVTRAPYSAPGAPPAVAAAHESVPWFLRGAHDRAGSTTASRQYAASYGGTGAVRPGSTSAGDQYRIWYTRPSNLAGTTSASEQYRSWYLRDLGGR